MKIQIYNAKKRRQIIDLALNYGCKYSDIKYMDKNSTMTDEKVINNIINFHCKNDTLARIFKEKVMVEQNKKK